MNRNAFFAALLGLLAAPFTWAASKLRADQLQAGSTGEQRLLTTGADNRFSSLRIGAGLASDGSTLTVVDTAKPLVPVILARNPDGSYPYSGGLVFRNGSLQVAPGDFTVTGNTLSFVGGNNADDTVVKI